MLGLNKNLSMALIFTYTISFILPSIILAYFLSYPCIYVFFDKILSKDEISDDDGQSLDYFPDANSTVFAGCFGLFIALVSVIYTVVKMRDRTIYE